jgi:hypothetical protein
MDAPRHTCPTCGLPSTPTASRLRCYDYRCDECARAYQRDRAARIKAETGRYPFYESQRAARQRYGRRRYASAEGRERFMARSLARRAISAGKLQREPCEVCGAAEVEAHHDDYSQPLKVRWLCRPHHRAHHAAERVAAQ